MSLKNINTWARGYFVDQRQYSRWSNARKAQAHKEEQCKVRPSPTGNAICICSTPEDAKWIAERLNLTVKLEQENTQLRNLLGSQGIEIPSHKSEEIENNIRSIQMKCPRCGEQMMLMYGCGLDYDKWICTSKKGNRLSDVCEGEIGLNVSTYPKEDDK